MFNLLLSLILIFSINNTPVEHIAFSNETRTSTITSCQTGWIYPLRNPEIIEEANIPEFNWKPGHRGIDLSATENTEIISPRNGMIEWKGVVAGVPLFTTMHNGIKATYSPAKTTLNIGEKVDKGEKIGEVVHSTNYHCNNCLHFGMVENEKYLDPKLVVEGVKEIVLVE